MRKQCKKCTRIYHKSVNQCIFDNSFLEEYPVYGVCPLCGEVITSSKFCFNDGTVVNLNPPLQEEVIGVVVGQKYLIEKFLETTFLFYSYLGENVKTGDKVTIKIIHPKFIANQNESNKFAEFIQKILQIKSENVLNIFDYSIERSFPQAILHCLITEYNSQSISLESLLKKEPVLSNDYKLNLLKQICSGLSAISREKIYPLAVCPEDVVIFPEKTKESVRINPYMKLPDPPPIETCGGPRYVPISKYQYCSPEAFIEQPLSSKSTVYSFGILIYYLLTYKFPYNDKSYHFFVVKTLNDKPASLRTLATNVPPQVENLVLRMLSQKAEERPSFSEITNLLEEAWQYFDTEEAKNHLEDQKGFPQNNKLINHNNPTTQETFLSDKTKESKTYDTSNIPLKDKPVDQNTKKSNSLFDYIKKLINY